MTVIEFKEAHPEFSDLTGDELWDKMEDTMTSSGESLADFFKKHRNERFGFSDFGIFYPIKIKDEPKRS